MDLFQFSSEYETFINGEEDEVRKAFLKLPNCKYNVRSEFNHRRIDFNTFAALNLKEKSKLHEEFANMLVDHKT